MSTEKILLNAGCGLAGSSRLPGMFSAWRELRVDIDPAVRPDIVADLVNLSQVGSGVIDAVWTAHCIEHLYEHDVAGALSEIRRVLRNDGFACIIVPDLQRIASWIVDDKMHEPIYTSAAGPITAHDIVYGYGLAIKSGATAMAHKCGFTPTSMIRHITSAGFGGYFLVRRPTFELAAVVRKVNWPNPSERAALQQNLGL